MQKKSVWLFIGRFQPGLHAWELDGIQQAMEHGVSHFLIWVWSSNKEFTRENPFTYDERKTMIDLSLRGMKGITYQIFPLPDMDSDVVWKQYIYDTLPDFDLVISWNSWVEEVFAKTKKVLVLKIRVPVKWTFLRNQLALWRIDEIQKSLPAKVLAYLIKIKAPARIKKFFRQEHWTPYLCVDVIFKDKTGQLVLIDRKNYPHGIALPWWFVQYGEDPKKAAIREVQEEVWVKISIKRLVGVYGDPKRDPRAHNVTIVYEGKYISGVFKAGSDAKAVKKIKCVKNELEKINFCFDHKKIISDYL